MIWELVGAMGGLLAGAGGLLAVAKIRDRRFRRWNYQQFLDDMARIRLGEKPLDRRDFR